MLHLIEVFCRFNQGAVQQLSSCDTKPDQFVFIARTRARQSANVRLGLFLNFVIFNV